MSLAQGNNTPTRPRIEPGSPDPEFDALTTRPVRPLENYCEAKKKNQKNSDEPENEYVFAYPTYEYTKCVPICLAKRTKEVKDL